MFFFLHGRPFKSKGQVLNIDVGKSDMEREVITWLHGASDWHATYI